MINRRRKEIIADLVKGAREFRFCGPSDDPEEQTAVTVGYRYLITQFKRLAAPILPPAAASQLRALDVDVQDIYSAYDAHSELDALLPEIETALERLDDDGDLIGPADQVRFIDDSRLAELRKLSSAQFDFKKLIRLCEELNTVYGDGCYFATAMLTRGLLDHVPPLFGKKTFTEVANNYSDGGRSFKENMQHLENAARNIADGHLHMQIRKSETLPAAQQVNFASQLDVLLSEIIRTCQ